MQRHLPSGSDNSGHEMTSKMMFTRALNPFALTPGYSTNLNFGRKLNYYGAFNLFSSTDIDLTAHSAQIDEVVPFLLAQQIHEYNVRNTVTRYFC